MKHICVFTCGRAEYGILKPLLAEIKRDHSLSLQLLVSGMHLSGEFGLTYREIEKDGYSCDERVEITMSSDTAVGVCKSIGLGLISYSEVLNRIRPDVLIVFGDRYETHAITTVAMVSGMPVAHIQGGELTYGAFDEGFRHSITKMSRLHFVSTDIYRDRVIQLGEEPKTVFNVGALNVEAVSKAKVIDRTSLETLINFEINDRTIVVTFHPVTLEFGKAQKQFGELVSALKMLPDVRVIFTKTNSDPEGRVINHMIDSFVESNSETSCAFVSLGQDKYVSLLTYVSAVVGNSSSGIIETPGLKLPTVNVGMRQNGRIKARNIIDTQPVRDEIVSSINKAFSKEFVKELRDMDDPYRGNNTSENIKNIIKEMNFDSLRIKTFHDVRGRSRC